jgi:FkbH-like protein
MAGPGEYSIVCVSDFTCEPLVRALRSRSNEDRFGTAPFNQVHQFLDQAAQGRHEALLVWTTPGGVIPSFAQAARFEAVDHEVVLAETERFAALIRSAAIGGPVLLASWSPSPSRVGYGLLDWRPGLGIANLIARMNLRLAECLADVPGVYILDSGRWTSGHSVQVEPESPRLWYAAKVPFHPDVYSAAAEDFLAGLTALRGQSRRLIVVDLDDTLWGGVVGDVGWQGLRLGPPDPVGEAFQDFQSALKELSTRGVQLAVVSKNTEGVAREALSKHPAMVLRAADFAGMRINWQDKARNVAELVSELGLGLASTVFIDDNPVERARVRDVLPDVLVPEWPADPMLFAQTLRSLRCFTPATLSTEDRARTRMYAQQRERVSAMAEVSSVADWLSSLETVVRIASVDEATFPRVTQLLNKTNQLNLRTRRLSEVDVRRWSEQDGHDLVAVSVQDRFGDLGLVGVLGIDWSHDPATVEDLVLSCRAMGRGVENTMVTAAWQIAMQRGATGLEFRYQPTERNAPTLEALRSGGLREEPSLVFGVDADDPPVVPEGITRVWDSLP